MFDNIEKPQDLLKKLSDLVNTNVYGKFSDGKLKINPKSEDEYRTIIRYAESEKIESFTYPLPSEQDLKIVIRGLSVSTEPQEVVAGLRDYGFSPTKCVRMRNFKEKRDLPLFIVFLPSL